MTHKDDIAFDVHVDGPLDRPHGIVDVDESVRRIAPADERQHAVRGQPEQRPEGPVARPVNHARPQDDPAQTGSAFHDVFARQLARAVRRQRIGNILFASRRRGRSGARGRKARDVYEARADRRRGRGDCSCPGHVDRVVRLRVESADDAGEMYDDVSPVERLSQRAGLKWRADYRQAGRRRSRRIGPDDPANLIAALGQACNQVPADEARRARDGDAAPHVITFS